MTAAARFASSIEAPARFAATHAERVAQACEAMARRFERGGRLLAFGTGAAESDARHLAVEFLHPVLVGKRALPALAVTDARTLAAVGRSADVVVGLSHGGAADPILCVLDVGRRLGMLTVALGGVTPGMIAAPEPADFTFNVESDDRMIVQEVHETLYHVMWELVHVFLDPRSPA